MFVVDVLLLVAVFVLLIVNISLRSPALFYRPIGLDLTLNSDALIADAATPIEARVRVLDGKQHENVHLVWHLPPWVEVIRAEPPLNRDGAVMLGSIVPTQIAVSRLYVRVRALPGTDVPFAFSLQEGIGIQETAVSGSDTRRVLKSALTIIPALPADAVEPGGSMPFIVSNKSSLEAQAVIVRIGETENVPQATLDGGDHIVIGNMLPGQEKTIFLDVDSAAQGDIQILLNAEDASHTVSSYETLLKIATPIQVSFREPLRSIPGNTSTDLVYQSATTAGVWVSHPLQVTGNSSTNRTYDLAPGSGQVHIPLRVNQHTMETTWSLIPYERRDGHIVLGKRLSGILSTAFPFRAEARYYSSTGDQLGVGPLPPRVGEATTYWVVWSVGPTDADLKDLQLSMALTSGVSATGKFASQIPGTFSSENGQVIWSVPSLPATGSSPATFAFEIRYVPDSGARGSAHTLTNKSSAVAVEVRSGLELQAVADAQDTNLEHDVQARGKGKVE